jgi:hypothetical protein
MNVCPRRKSPKIPVTTTNPIQRLGSHTLITVGSTDTSPSIRKCLDYCYAVIRWCWCYIAQGLCTECSNTLPFAYGTMHWFCIIPLHEEPWFSKYDARYFFQMSHEILIELYTQVLSILLVILARHRPTAQSVLFVEVSFLYCSNKEKYKSVWEVWKKFIVWVKICMKKSFFRLCLK